MKTTKRALFSSVIALILCFSMLVGTTFAWFTDSVESGVNKIIAGNLDVELYHKGNQVTNTYDKLFKDIKWEPGVVAYENITVANEGTLALKYQLGINFTDATTNANGDTLAKVLKVGFVKGGIQSGTREGALDEVSAWLPLESFVQSGKLLPENYNGDPVIGASQVSDTYGIVIYWQPSDIDNEFNMNNENRGKVMSINLGIKLLATQLEAEDDSFDETYDEDAWQPDMFVTTAAELAKAIEEVKDGGIIALAADLTFNEESRMFNSGTYYDGLYYDGDKSFTIDLNGKTITNDSAVNDYLLNFKNSGAKPNTITIKNGTIEAASSAYCAIATASSNAQKITINLENVNLIGNNSNGAVAKIRGGAELNVKAGTVITGKNSYIGIEAAGKNTVVNIYDGAEIYQKGTSSYCGSLVGVSGGATANVYGGSGVSAKGCFIAMTSGGTINIYGGEWVANTNGTVANDNNAVLIAQSEKHWKSIINVYGGTFKGGYNCYGAAAGDAQINISAGTFNADPSEYVADGFKAVATGGKYVVVSESVDAAVSTPAELTTKLEEAAAAGAGDSTIVLTGDIDMTGTTWTPISVDGYHGAGVVTIEGNGATIKGLNAPLFAGGFAGKSGIVIKNLTIADSNIVGGNQGGGAFIDCADSMHVITLDNCHLVNSTVSGERAGGLIGWCSGYAKLDDGPVKAYVTITNCSVVDSTVIGNGSAGGIAGHPGASDYTYTTIENCVVKNVDVVSYEPVSSWRTGAIVGTANNGHVVINNVTVENVTLTQDGVTAEETKLYGRFVPSGTGTLVIDGAYVLPAATQEALNNAISTGETEISLPAGNYTLPSAVAGKEVTISGSKDTVIDVTSSINMGSGDLVFDGVTVLSNGGGFNNGIQHVDTIVYQNATIVGSRSLYGNKEVFINCTFDLTGVSDYIWVYGANEAEFINCTFNTNGKALLIYNEGDGDCKVTVKGCTFNATTGAKAGDITNQNCAAIEIYNFAKSGVGLNHTLITEGNTINGDFSGEWRIKNFMAGGVVTVNGVQYTKTALDGELMTVTNKVAAFD